MSIPRYRIVFLLLLISLPVWHEAQGDVSMPAIFSDHMVLQQRTAVPVWGTDIPGSSITVRFNHQEQETRADQSGHWMIHLDPMEASADPGELQVTGSSSLAFKDVLIGEVWFCSGQSNMEKPLGKREGQQPTENFEATLRQADDSGIRLFHVSRYGKIKDPQWQMKWVSCSAESLQSTGFSAVAYYFANTLREETGIPVGIIHSSFGGTMIEAWTPHQAMQEDPILEPLLHRHYFSWVDGVQATDLYQSMVKPIIPFAVHGFLWYQGEANVMYAEGSVYTRKMQALIRGWRQAWMRPEAPFLYVQLAPFNYSEWDKFARQLTPEALPLFWEAQTQALAVKGTGMIITTDLAGRARDIHPVKKKEVGQRLAWLALETLTGEANTSSYPHSPSYIGCRLLKEQVLIEFNNAEKGLTTRDGNAPTHFVISGPDKVFHPAQAQIQGNKVIVQSPKVTDPVAVRFAWHETANPNLISKDGLPAGPFRTDNWDIKNEK